MFSLNLFLIQLAYIHTFRNFHVNLFLRLFLLARKTQLLEVNTSAPPIRYPIPGRQQTASQQSVTASMLSGLFTLVV